VIIVDVTPVALFVAVIETPGKTAPDVSFTIPVNVLWACAAAGSNRNRPTAIDADLREYMSMLFYTEEARAAFAVRAPSLVYRQKVNKAVWSDLQRFDLNPELPKFRFPTLVITGRYDFNVAPSVAWSIHRAIPGSELAVFEKSGHLPFCEETDGFVSKVEAFLSRH
jgi:proline iminopeptidase